MKSDLITPEKALELLAMPTDTPAKLNNGKWKLRKLAIAGVIKGYQFGQKKSIRYSEQSISQYIESCLMSPLHKKTA